MLSPTARKFCLSIWDTDNFDHLPTGYTIEYGQYSSRIDPRSGVKARDATLLRHNKTVARYHAATDEVVVEF